MIVDLAWVAGPPVQPDVDKLYALINVWDHRCKTPGGCPHPDGAVTRFAALLGRGRSSFYNLRSGKRLGRGFAAQIAAALHVEVADITLPETAEPETPQPGIEAEAA
jgi:hypothetical protein